MRFLVVLFFASVLHGQPPDQPDLSRIRQQLNQLQERLRRLPESDLKPDAEIYAKAVEWILRHPEEFYSTEYVTNALDAARTGIERVAELEAGKASWTTAKGYIKRAYRSRVDGSVQPYAVWIPEGYNGAPMRLDVCMHGRADKMNEVSFLADKEADCKAEGSKDYIQLDVFGRTNNAYRWAGETDVFEALENVKKRYKIDDFRVILRGFSMGGAGAWHIGLQHPSEWAAVEAGAGFNETLRYAKQKSLHPVVEKLLTIYDAYRYALNAANVPFVGYGGAEDPQLQSSKNVQEQLEKEGVADLRVLFLIGPRTKHKWHPESKKESEAFLRASLPRSTPERIRFVTYTLRYPDPHWIRLEGLERHYERAEVDAHGRMVSTKNISRIRLMQPAGGWEIDRQRVAQAGANAAFEKADGKWRVAKGAARGKRPGLQGPIDDAFTESFLCVRPTGHPLNMSAHQFAMKRLDMFRREYAKWLRADVPLRDDTQVSDSDIRNSNLVLFGDAGSNRLLARVLKELPIEWSLERVRIGGKNYDASTHLPVLIAPNPLNPEKYVVINSGHTFGEKEFRGTNALLFPRIGDWGVLRTSDGSLVETGLFDEQWR